MSSSATDEAQRELPEAVVEDILLRLDAGADVVRASAACQAYRRITCDRAFLRRLRLRPPQPPPVVVGAFDAASHFHRAEPPHPSAAAAVAVARAADLAFSFLPDPAAGSWRVRDVRDGRVLLSRRGTGNGNSDDLVVCDPVHRRFVQIPPIPDGLADAPHRYGALELEHFLAPAGDDDSPLRVMSNAQCAWKIETLVFSSATGDWQHLATCNFNGYYARIKDLDLFVRHYANGCFYWTHHNRSTIIVLDTRSMTFSHVIRPYELRQGCGRRQSLAVVDAGDGEPGLVAVAGTRLNLYRQEGVHYKMWQHKKTIFLPYGYRWYIMAGASKGVLLLRAQCSQPQQMTDSHYFTMDLQTWRLEWMCTRDQTVMLHHLYARHPPPLSSPSIPDGLLSSHIDQD